MATKKDDKNLPTTMSEDDLAQYAVDVAAEERPSVSNISFRNGILKYSESENAAPDNKIDVIIVSHCFERTLYREKFDGDNIATPECFSLGFTKESMEAHKNVEKNGNPGGNCHDCQYNQWGSDLDGRKGKACKEKRRLAAIPYMKGMTIENITEAEVALMSVPVMSVRNWSNYVQKVSASMKRPPWSVITTVSVVPDPKSQFRVLFEHAGDMPGDSLNALNAKRLAVETALFTPFEKGSGDAEEPVESEKF